MKPVGPWKKAGWPSDLASFISRLLISFGQVLCKANPELFACCMILGSSSSCVAVDPHVELDDDLSIFFRQRFSQGDVQSQRCPPSALTTVVRFSIGSWSFSLWCSLPQAPSDHEHGDSSVSCIFHIPVVSSWGLCFQLWLQILVFLELSLFPYSPWFLWSWNLDF